MNETRKDFRQAMLDRHNAYGLKMNEKFITPFPQHWFRAGADQMRLEIIERLKAEIETREKEKMLGDEGSAFWRDFGAIAALECVLENLENNFIYDEDYK